jgi:hypothetical protein
MFQSNNRHGRMLNGVNSDFSSSHYLGAHYAKKYSFKQSFRLRSFSTRGTTEEKYVCRNSATGETEWRSYNSQCTYQLWLDLSNNYSTKKSGLRILFKKSFMYYYNICR